MNEKHTEKREDQDLAATDRHIAMAAQVLGNPVPSIKEGHEGSLSEDLKYLLYSIEQIKSNPDTTRRPYEQLTEFLKKMSIKGVLREKEISYLVKDGLLSIEDLQRAGLMDSPDRSDNEVPHPTMIPGEEALRNKYDLSPSADRWGYPDTYWLKDEKGSPETPESNQAQSAREVVSLDDWRKKRRQSPFGPLLKEVAKSPPHDPDSPPSA